MCVNCSKCMKLLDALVNLGIFVCVCILCSLSRKNPFKSHRIGDINIYFKPTSNISRLFGHKCLCEDVTINRTCSEEEMSEGCKLISNDNSKFKRYYNRKLASGSFCSDMYESFVKNNGSKLSFLFDLNYGVILKLSIALLVVSLSYFVAGVIIACCKKNINNLKYYLYERVGWTKERCFFLLIIFIVLTLWIGRIVLTILLFYYVENGDIQKYDEFLDCGSVKSKYFKKFSDVNKLRKCFLAFGVLNIISEVIGKAQELFEPPDENEDDRF